MTGSNPEAARCGRMLARAAGRLGLPAIPFAAVLLSAATVAPVALGADGGIEPPDAENRTPSTATETAADSGPGDPGSSDPGPGDSASVLTLEGVGAIPASVLEYRVREPAAGIAVAPRLTLLAVGPDGSQYALQLIVSEAGSDDPFAKTWDVGAASADATGGERSAITTVKDGKDYVSREGTVALRSAGGDRFEAELEATMVPAGASQGASEDDRHQLRGHARGVWTFTCFAVAPAPGVDDGSHGSAGAWGVDGGVDGGAVAWILDAELTTPYCARFSTLVPR